MMTVDVLICLMTLIKLVRRINYVSGCLSHCWKAVLSKKHSFSPMVSHLSNATVFDDATKAFWEDNIRDLEHVSKPSVLIKT